MENVGNVENWGLEGTFRMILNENFDLYLAASYLDTEATNLQDICGLDNANACEGSGLFWAPDVTLAVVVNGDFPLASGASITTSLEVLYESERGGGFEGLRCTTSCTL